MATPEKVEQLDQPAAFEKLSSILDELHNKLKKQLTVFPKDQQPFQHFASPDGSVNGSLLTFTGEVIDKLIYTNINALSLGFSTLRLAIWLKSSIQVPHLVFEFGTLPNLFFYMDYIPRVDLWADFSYLEQYYEVIGSTHLDLRNNSDLSIFISKSLYVRQLQSPAHICFTGSSTDDSLSLVRSLAHEICDRWLTWVEQAHPVPIEAQAALAERDLRMRQISAERDPGNAVAANFFGEDFTNQLVQALWQGESGI